MQAKDRIIVALDVDTKDEALALVKNLKDYVGAFKVGMQLYNSIGPEIVKLINDLGGKVFVDLKFHDIPNTVAAAGRVMTRLNCFMFNVHAAGGKEMMSTLAKAISEEADKLGSHAPVSLAVTVLTSISQNELEKEMLIKNIELKELVVKWALMAQESGITGVVCSPQEITAVRQACGPGFKIVTPGIRPAWSAKNDQKRITTPRQALDMGADYMVIGRPITRAQNPIEAAQKIIDELEA
ncbi:MAG: orotidine-5'-phosphate decarboxylase [Syntrophomonadaceae bacterium]|nr:orotidine-5'-phosphate decarboxylase [Syntrophomonadaceae bacterium]MDD3889322.1 orotidine-5'-phosphate decarboxylase [Syntrophomonadaceae bacterium]MDD4550248.1 orotidine-5'-phosphate decarboxylase [Syntrophomonadaceae bacterium]